MSTMSAEQARDKALRGGLTYLAARLLLQSFQWVATVLVARLLQPEHYGLMAVIAIITELAALMASGGFGAALVQKHSTTREQEGQLFTLSLILAGIGYVAIWLAAPLAADYLKSAQFELLVRVASLVLLLVPINMICLAIVERDLRFTNLAAVQLMMGVLQALVVLSLAYAGYGVWALAIGQLCASTFGALATWYLSGWRPTLAWPDAGSVGLIRFGATVAATSLIWFVNTNADKAVVTALLGPAALGIYALAYQFAAMPVDRITSNFNRASYPTYGRLRGEPEKLQRWYLRMVAALFATIGPALIGAALVSSDALPMLLGEKWRQLVLPFQVLAPAGVVMSVATTLAPLLNALGRPDIPMKYEILGAIVYPASMAVAGAYAGITGICAVWVVVYPIMVLGLVHFSSEVTGVPLGRFIKELAPFAKALLLMVAAVLLVRAASGDMSPMTRLLLSIVVGAAVYVTSGILFIGQGAALKSVEFIKGLMSRKAEA